MLVKFCLHFFADEVRAWREVMPDILDGWCFIALAAFALVYSRFYFEEVLAIVRILVYAG
jgi:hypothetical protein